MPAGALSIVVPTRDTRELLRRCLASLAPLAGAEVLVVDDGSTDGTAAALAPHFPQVRWLRHERPQGFARAANAGLAAASGELLLLLNSDTELLAGDAAALAARFGREPRLGAVGARLRNPDGSPQWSGGREPTLAWFFALGSALPARLAASPLWRRARPVSGAVAGAVEWLPGTALVLARAAWRAAGPLEESYRFYAQDLELCSRLRGAGFTLAVADELVVLHRLGGTVATGAGAFGGQRLDLLWCDLLHWAARVRGPRWAGRARRALERGAALRAAALGASCALARGERRARLAAERGALAAARQALAGAPQTGALAPIP